MPSLAITITLATVPYIYSMDGRRGGRVLYNDHHQQNDNRMSDCARDSAYEDNYGSGRYGSDRRSEHTSDYDYTSSRQVKRGRQLSDDTSPMADDNSWDKTSGRKPQFKRQVRRQDLTTNGDGSVTDGIDLECRDSVDNDSVNGGKVNKSPMTIEKGFTEMRQYVAQGNLSIKGEIKGLQKTVNDNNWAVNQRINQLEGKNSRFANDTVQEIGKLRDLVLNNQDELRQMRGEIREAKQRPTYAQVTSGGEGSDKYFSPKRFNVLVEGLEESTELDPYEQSIKLLTDMNLDVELEDLKYVTRMSRYTNRFEGPRPLLICFTTAWKRDTCLRLKSGLMRCPDYENVFINADEEPNTRRLKGYVRKVGKHCRENLDCEVTLKGICILINGVLYDSRQPDKIPERFKPDDLLDDNNRGRDQGRRQNVNGAGVDNSLGGYLATRRAPRDTNPQDRRFSSNDRRHNRVERESRYHDTDRWNDRNYNRFQDDSSGRDMNEVTGAAISQDARISSTQDGLTSRSKNRQGNGDSSDTNWRSSRVGNNDRESLMPWRRLAEHEENRRIINDRQAPSGATKKKLIKESRPVNIDRNPQPAATNQSTSDTTRNLRSGKSKQAVVKQAPKPKSRNINTVIENMISISMNGALLQKVTPSGIIFCGARSVYSNFHPCLIKHDGHDFHSSEQLYQYLKCCEIGDMEAVNLVLDATTGLDAKLATQKCKGGAKWRKMRVPAMRVSISKKFRQNEDKRAVLLSSAGSELVEATMDDFWGGKAVYGDQAFMDKTYEGDNMLGKLLVELRTELLSRESEKSRKVCAGKSTKNRPESDAQTGTESETSRETTPKDENIDAASLESSIEELSLSREEIEDASTKC